jgi:tripartite-type tricarboxylate transporter receptor subunit TctC
MKLLRLALTALALSTSFCADAQDYPVRPVRVVIPYAAGGGVDAAARLVAQGLSSAMGQPFLVEAKPGGSTIVGADAVARAAPDGYTVLLTGGSTMSLLPLTSTTRLPFNPLTDFEPIGMVSRMPFFLVTSGSQPYKSAKDLMDAARAKDGALSFASNGTGAMGHVGTEMLLQAAGVKMIHVPYAGFAPALSDLVTGRVSMVMADFSPVAGQLQAGKLRALAVASPQRAAFLPDVPTLAESGFPNSNFEIWLALYAPAKTPKPILDRLSAELSRYMATPAAREAFAKLGQEADADNAAVVRNRIVTEQKAYAPVVRAAGLAAAK